MRLCFLDIDGVLNNHEWDEGAQSTRIKYECIKHLNRIIKETGVKIVLSSAWRYMILRGAMTTLGFEYLLRTHGIVGARVIGTTASDEEMLERSDQIKDFLKSIRRTLKQTQQPGCMPETVESYVILDDDPMSMDGTSLKTRLVKTDGKVGLTAKDADKAIGILNRKPRS